MSKPSLANSILLCNHVTVPFSSGWVKNKVATILLLPIFVMVSYLSLRTSWFVNNIIKYYHLSII